MSRLGDFVPLSPAQRLVPARGRGAEGGAEPVRQWVLRRLVEVYGYPPAWLSERVALAGEDGFAVLHARGRPFLHVLTRPAGGEEAALAAAERALAATLLASESAALGLVTDGRRTRVLRRTFEPSDIAYASDLPAFSPDMSGRTPLKPADLQPLTDRYERLLFELHSTIRDVDGLHDDEALDELAKLLYTKIYDERAGAQLRFQVAGASSPSEAAALVRGLYREAQGDGAGARGLFHAPLRLGDAALYRVVEQLQGFSLASSGADIKGRAFQRVLAPAIRAGMGQYFTPDPVVALAVGIVDPAPGERILDPFCGSGHFLARCREHALARGGPPDLHGIEKSERMVRIALTDLLLHDEGRAQLRHADALAGFENYPALQGAFDVVVTNPPFGSVVRQEALAMLGRFELAQGRKSVALEVLGLERCLEFLRPGGRLAIVLPEGVLKNKNLRAVRRWVEQVAELRAIVTLPEDAFTPLGAMVRTCLCVLRKFEVGERPGDAGRCLLAEVENLGVDATGRPRAGSEVEAAVAAFHREVGWR